MAGRPQEYFEALRHSGVPRRPWEYFDPEAHGDIVERLAFREMPDRPPEPSPLWSPGTYGSYLTWAKEQGTTPNGVFGAKVMWGYMADFADLLRGIPGMAGLPVPELLAWAFPGLRYVRVTRRDKVRQAVSLWKAVQTQAWRHGIAAAAEPSFDLRAIDHLVRQLQEHDAAWTGYFTGVGVEPLVVTYEDLAAAHEPAVRRVLEYLGIEEPHAPACEPPKLRIQADATSEAWVERYLAAIPLGRA